MIDATLSALLREAQRAGRLGVLSPGARDVLDSLADAMCDAGNFGTTTWRSPSNIDKYRDDRVDLIWGKGPADDAREVGKFLRELLAVLL